MEKITNQIQDYWIILAFIASMIIWWANVNNRITSVEGKVVEQVSVNEQIAELKTDVAVIKANVEFIKQQVR